MKWLALVALVIAGVVVYSWRSAHARSENTIIELRVEALNFANGRILALFRLALGHMRHEQRQATREQRGQQQTDLHDAHPQ